MQNPTSYKLSQQFPNKRAFITGAASGLGKALCMELANDNWQIGMMDIHSENLKITALEVEKRGGKSYLFPTDVSDQKAYKAAAEEFISQCEGIDLLINNAGVGDGSTFENYSLENWHWMVGINQMAVIYGCHFFVPIMQRQQSGHIINVSSAAAFSNAGGMSPYNVTKAAVLSLSESLYIELHSKGIHVSVVMPTFFNTNVIQHGRGSATELETAKYLLATSGLEPETVAQTLLKKAGNNQLYIVLPGISRFLFWTKRYMPRIFLRVSRSLYLNRDKHKERLRKKYEKNNPS